MNTFDERSEPTAAIHALRPERSLLSSMMQDPAQWIGRALEGGLSHEHFHLPSHRTLFGVLRELYVKGENIEMVSLVQLLHERGILDSIGGPAAVTEIFCFALNNVHFDENLKQVKDMHALRSMIQSCINASGSQDETDILLESLGIRQDVSTYHDFSLYGCVCDALERFQKKLAGEKMDWGLSTGFEDLDRMVGGLLPGKVYVIASRPSMGKTSLMLNIAEHICIKKQVPTLIFSGDMRPYDIVERIIFTRAKFALNQLSRGYTPNKGDLQRIQRAALDLTEANLIIDDAAGISIDALCARARRAKRERGIGFIAIDHFHLLKSDTKKAMESREREVIEIFSGIKSLAKELAVPILVLAQLNRDPESRNARPMGYPRLSDLRDSVAIENDADMVGLLYRPSYYAKSIEDEEAYRGKACLIISKNKNGATGWVPLTFIADLARFETGPPNWNYE